jgi:hypothetical protein
MTLDFQAVRAGFAAAGIPPDLVTELLDAFTEAKRRYYRTDLRPSAVEGGRFAEATFRVLQWATTGKYTPIGKTLPKVDQLLVSLENGPGNDSVRLHIPRTLRLIYDIRNKRDAAHLADGIDPNMQDATLVVRNMEWVLAELVRLYHKVPPDEAQKILTDLVTKEIPVIQLFEDFPRVLRDLRASDHTLVLLYWRGAKGASFAELSAWVRSSMRANLRRTLTALDKKNLVHSSGTCWFITFAGEQKVEAAALVEPG